MKLATAMSLFAAIMLVLCGAAVSLAIWNTRQAEFYLERVHLADDSYARHLSLTQNAYQLVKKLADARLIDKQPYPMGIEALQGRIRDDLEMIREITDREVALVGESEAVQYGELAKFEARLAPLLAMARGEGPAPTGDAVADWRLLSDAVDRGGETFREMVTAALEEELEDLYQVRAEADRQAQVSAALALFLALFAIGTTAAALLIFRRRLFEPIATLVSTIRKFGNGDYSARAPEGGKNEMAEIAIVLNEMASEVEASATAQATRRRELENAVSVRTQQLEGLLEDAKVASRERRQLLADVSHELRTPLTIIRGEADIALRGEEKTPTTYRDALERVRAAADHTARLVDDLLFVARAEAGAVRLSMADINLVDIVSEASLRGDRDITYQNSVYEAWIEGDADRIRQCVLIMMENARRYGGGEVVVRLDTAVGGFRIAVEDDGPGMTDDEKSKAFQRFFRGSNAAERYVDGAGLGLPVAKSIVEAHGGSIQLLDRPGGGLVSVIILPGRVKKSA